MIACLPSLAGPAEDEEDCEGGFAPVCRMLSLYSLMCSSLTPLAMVIAFFKFTSPRNVSLMISRVWSSTYLSDALADADKASIATLI